jgi:transposase-like protein
VFCDIISEMETIGKRCPVCGLESKQKRMGFNRSGTQRCLCKVCRKSYTINPKRYAYPEEVRQIAIKEYYAGASGRVVGQLHGMSKANVYNWIKKNSPKPEG